MENSQGGSRFASWPSSTVQPKTSYRAPEAPKGIEPEDEVRYFLPLPLVEHGPYRAHRFPMDADCDSPQAVMAADSYVDGGDPMDIDSLKAPETHEDRMQLDSNRAPEASVSVKPGKGALRAPISKSATRSKRRRNGPFLPDSSDDEAATASKRKPSGPFQPDSSDEETDDGEDVQVWAQLNQRQEPQTYVVTPTSSPKEGKDWTWCGIPGPEFLRMIEAQKQKKAHKAIFQAGASHARASQASPSHVRTFDPLSLGILELRGRAKSRPAPERREVDSKQPMQPVQEPTPPPEPQTPRPSQRPPVPKRRTKVFNESKPKKTAEKPNPAPERWTAMCGPEESLFVSSDEEESKENKWPAMCGPEESLFVSSDEEESKKASKLVYMGRYKMTRKKPVKKAARK